MSETLKEFQDRIREDDVLVAEPVAETEPAGGERRKDTARTTLADIAVGVEKSFHQGNRVLSFEQYLDLFASHPARYGRNAAQYVRDMFAFYGTRQVDRPWGRMTRFNLFDAPWAAGESLALQPRLVGQERLQNEVYRALLNFSREGRANRLLLMHGPNGSAKSTCAACILRALENYSQRDEGALYRFHWIFPSRKTSRGSLGFGGGKPEKELESFAHLEDADIDARLVMELRDHPLFLLPLARRRELIDRLWRDAGVQGKPSEWLYDAELSHKNKQIFEALLADYNGSLLEVLRHVQVERYFISRRYRLGAVTLGPEMSVDASERQVTADRSLAALPTSLQATTLFEAHGEIVDAAGGVLEFSDLLKRPIDTFRYLQLSLETGEVSLSQQTIVTNVVMVGSANDIHLSAFREHPEYPSFRGRVEFMRVPYLKSYHDEELIYLMQIAPQLRRHVAPHTIRLAAEFAVLTRMRRPDPNRYDKPLRDIVDSLTAVEKLDLYADGTPPKRLRNEERKLLRANVGLLYRETDSDVDYEGNIGISPRDVRTLLLDAAQSAEFHCVSPFALLKYIEALCRRTAEFEWLKLKPLSGGYHDHKHFRDVIRERLMDRIEMDVRAASGLIETGQYATLFTRYISHVSAWVKGEKMRNKITNRDEDPDEKLMREVESLFDSKAEPREQRDGMISMIAAWAIDHPGREPVVDEIFPDHVKRLEKAAYEQKRRPIAQLLRAVVTRLRDEGLGLEPSQRRDAEKMFERLRELGYDQHSAADAASALLRERYGDLVA
jgi:serine protein kinase